MQSKEYLFCTLFRRWLPSLRFPQLPGAGHASSRDELQRLHAPLTFDSAGVVAEEAYPSCGVGLCGVGPSTIPVFDQPPPAGAERGGAAFAAERQHFWARLGAARAGSTMCHCRSTGRVEFRVCARPQRRKGYPSCMSCRARRARRETCNRRPGPACKCHFDITRGKGNVQLDGLYYRTSGSSTAD